jgi:hypothetical protein
MSEEKKPDVSHPVASNLAALFLEEASAKDKTIIIPSLGIKIKPEKN